MVNPIGSNQDLWAQSAKPAGAAAPAAASQDAIDALLGQLQQAQSGDSLFDGSSTSPLDISAFGGDLQAVDPTVAAAMAAFQGTDGSSDPGQQLVGGSDASLSAVPSASAGLVQSMLASYLSSGQSDTDPSDTDSPGLDLFA